MTSTLTLAQRARNTGHARSHYQICLIHPFDPRGEKVGGLETYIRDFITFHPTDTDLLFIGVDSVGDLSLGEVHKLTFRGRNFDFLPILHYSDHQAREAARSIRTSLTGQFFMALLRHFGTISKLIRARRCSIDLRRVEFSWLPAVLRLPFVQMLHGEGAPKLQMDSLLRKYSFVHNAGERFAMATSAKFLCVNPYITERLQKTYPRQKEKIDTLWTWVNTDIFKPQPLPRDTTTFRIVFAGRLDEFKDPPLMFRTIARLQQLMQGKVEFHYIGTSDPHRFTEFGEIEDITIRHGFKDAAGMASTLAQAHAGILTSEFEGMPRFVLETLAVGRPVVAMHLPQLEAVIRGGESGYLVPRSESGTDMAHRLAQRFIEVRDLIAKDDMDSSRIAASIRTFTPGTQLARVFRYHQEIQNMRGMTTNSQIY
ncbi:glycosyltransferase [Bradyrhizobium sp. G127]|jgi:glycosyltransferase involved in cell wall biosynthesis|uniref:glycosyltransferase family 4 protein n=1 Tax=Bradyrhizobium sp. G127 TaxID=2904800 RepID=UPI001F2D731F|nr:glycosyltransferase [Bradyrhizobium sp. G127]MCF2522410.1 glycosyltransferase [Bradyrhizobium sp. G127]